MRKFLRAALCAAIFTAPLAKASDDAGINRLYKALSSAAVTTDTAGVTALYGPDSVYLGTGLLPLFGASSISSTFVKSWKTVTSEGAHIELKFRLQQRIWHGASEATDIGYSRFAVIYDDKTKAPRVFYDKFVTLSQRQADGTWRWRIDTDTKLPDPAAADYYEALKPIGGLAYDD